MKIEDIAERIIRLCRSYPGVNISYTKRDVKSDFKPIRIRPDGVKLFSTEFHGRFFGLSSSVVAFYMALPLGWSGSPGCFAQIALAIPKWHNAHAQTCPETSGEESFPDLSFRVWRNPNWAGFRFTMRGKRTMLGKGTRISIWAGFIELR